MRTQGLSWTETRTPKPRSSGAFAVSIAPLALRALEQDRSDMDVTAGAKKCTQSSIRGASCPSMKPPFLQTLCATTIEERAPNGQPATWRRSSEDFDLHLCCATIITAPSLLDGAKSGARRSLYLTVRTSTRSRFFSEFKATVRKPPRFGQEIF